MRIEVPLETPSEWKRTSTKWLFDRVRREPRETDGIVTAFRDGEVTLRAKRRTDGFTNAVQEFGYQGVRRGDLVIHSMDGFAGAIGVSDSDGKSSPVVHCYTPAVDADTRYYAYVLRDLAQRGYINSLAKGIRERSTAFDAETFRSLLLPQPPLAEQRAIADYLDAETARIDALIAKKQQLIHLLRERSLKYEKRLTLGNGALRVPLRWSMQIGSGEGIPPDDVHDLGSADVPVIGGNGISGYTDRKSIVEEPSLAIGRVGALCGNVHLVDPPAWITDNALWMRRIVGFDRRYLAAAIRAADLNQQADRTAQPLITGEKVKALRIPQPPLSDQAAIVDALETSRLRTEGLLSLLTTQISLLAERRQALITAAVTGEFKVPGAP